MKGKIGSRLLATLKPQDKPFEVFDQDVKGFILRQEPKGRRAYYVAFTLLDGTRGRVKLGDAAVLNPALARDMAKEKLALVAQGQDPRQEKKAARAHTLGSFIDEEYGPWLVANRKAGRGMLKELLSTCKPLLGRKLGEITPWVVEKWRSEYVKAGHPVAANRYLAYLKSCLTRAVEWQHLEEHPLRRVKRAKEDAHAKVRYLSADEDKRLLDALDAREERFRVERDRHNARCRTKRIPEGLDLRKVAYVDHVKPVILLSLNTGLRRGEVFSLTWDDVNLEGAMVTVRGERAKSGRTRHVPLNSVALDVLTKWRSQTSGTGLVFPSRDGHQFAHIKKAWATVLKEAGITAFRWHDQRHDFASKLVMAGVDLNTVRELLGHSTLTMTLRYAHLAPKVKADAVERLVSRQSDNVITFPAMGAARERRPPQ